MYKFNPFTFKLDRIPDTSGFATKALDNLASVAINTSLISDTDSTDDLGSSSKYWANGYLDKIYLNSTASLDGATAAGLIDATGSIRLPLGASFWVGDYTETSARVRMHHNSSNGYIDYSTGALYFRNGNTAVLTLSSTNTIQADGAFTATGNINVLKSDPIILLSDTIVAGFRSEVGGELVDFGTNYSQIGFNDGTKHGAFFRIDTRTGYETELFSIIDIPANSSEEAVFRVATTGNVYFKGSLNGSTTNQNISIIPNGTGYTIIGDAGTTSHSFNTNDDLLVSGRLEVDGAAYFDSSITIVIDNNFIFSLNGAGFSERSTGGQTDTLFIFPGSTDENIIISAFANRTKDHDHTAQTNPTLFIHSVTDPDTANTQWISLTHNQTNGVINTGTGNLTFGQTLTSDTDSTDDLGTSSIYWANTYTDKIYLNSTGILDGASAGIKLSGNLGFYGTTPIAQQTGVAVTAAGIHAALVALGLITA